jgi:EAL domain-containing protein (putative c-di-GMP-specific phosphodiesterase class I)
MTTKKTNILLIEDNPGDARLIEVMLAETGSLLFSLEHAASLYEGIEHLEKSAFDVVLLDIGLPDGNGLDSIIEITNKVPDTPVVMMTGLDDEETAIAALRMGAQDYLVKGRIDSRSLLRSIRYAIERRHVEEDLWSSRQFIQRVTEAAPNIIYVFDLGAGHPALSVAVNLSSRHIQSPRLTDSVSRILSETGLAPAYLRIEISETTDITEKDFSLSNLTGLAGMGIRIALDNFGKGKTPVHYLKKWPVSSLKIDKSFISGLSSDPDYKSVVNAVITMAHQLGLDVTAGGVETEEQLSYLQLVRCDQMQGYFFSRPLPAAECIKFISS